MATLLDIESSRSNRVVVVLGPTGVGKTALADALSAYCGGIIYADTACFYRDINIGTAKPSPVERRRVSHYLLDFLELNEEIDVGDYVSRAADACRAIFKSGKPACLTGGSLFYIKKFLFGLTGAPKATEVGRSRAARFLEERGAAAAFAELARIDPVSAGRLHVNDVYRVSRALEVFYDTGRPLSFYPEPVTLTDAYDFFIVALTRDRDDLYARIDARVEEMWRAGLPDEVNALKKRGVSAQFPAMKAIGYAEFFGNDRAEPEIKERIKQNSRRYAKRQETFIKKLPVSLSINLTHDGDPCQKVISGGFN